MANSLILTKAQNAVTAHDWTTAARYYKELLRGDEANAEYLKQLGSIYVRAGQDEKAIPYYEQLITFNKNNTDAMVSLGAIFRRLKRYEDSVNILHQAQDISSESSAICYNLGFTYKEMGDYDDAIDAFEHVISRNPDDVLAHNHLGAIYFAKKEYPTSINAYKRGLQVDQNHPILNYNLAHVYEEIHNYPEAVRCYEVALKTRPGWLDAIRDFSELLIRCQDTKQAQELVEQSIKLHPDDVELLCILGRIYLNQFDYENATKTFSRAEDLKQNDISILVGLSKSLEKGCKIEQAMEKILDAVDIAPEDLEVCKQYAHVLLSAQRYEKALDMIKKIDEKSGGKDLQVLDLFGQYFVCRGDDEASEAYFSKIRKLNHHYKDYLINAADRYIQTGNYEKAQEMAEKFIASRPQLPEGYNMLGTIDSARGDLTKAKLDYEKGISFKNPNIYAVKELEKINTELEANKEIYNNGEMPIAIDADKLSKEEGGNLPDENAADAEENAEEKAEAILDSDDDDDFGLLNSLESTPPIEQALSGEDGEFWEDFDDDPDAANRPLIDEDSDAYDENAEDTDLMSMMTPDAAEDGESLESGLSAAEDDFSFDDFEDARLEDEDAIAPGLAAGEQAGPDAEAVADGALETEAADEEPAASDGIQTPVNPVYDEDGPALEVPDSQPAKAAPEMAPEAAGEMMPEAGTEAASEALPEENTASETMTPSDAQQMIDDLKQQQKELELQQRELAIQQKELADNLKEENEKMIHETVEKAVEEAVEEKFSNYDLQAEPSLEGEDAVSEELAEEAEVGEVASEEEVPAEDVSSEDVPAAVIEDSADDEIIAESTSSEEPSADEIPSDDFDLQLYDDDFTDVGFGDELSEESEGEEDAMDYTAAPFVTAEELESLCGSSDASLELDDASAFEITPDPYQDLTDENFITADDMVEKIGRILNDDERAKTSAAELELFKKLRVLSGFLPEKEKNSFDCCRMRMVIEYIILKMSGKPGLLITAESLIKSGVLGEEYNRQLEDCCEEELSNDLIRHVITDMKKLAQGLEDRELCNALCVSADGILEQIALLDQKSAIF